MTFILALETTEQYGHVALLHNRDVLAELPLSTDRRSAQTLAPTLACLLGDPELWDRSLLPETLSSATDRPRNRISPREIDCVAVVVGPGSFTGLRVGLATAKMFAYAAGAKIVGVDTHETIAEAFSAWWNESDRKQRNDRQVSIGVDAQRGDVVAQRFEWKEEKFEPIEKARLISVNAWWEQAEENGSLLFAGPALERWGSKAPETVRLAEECYWTPRAEFAGKIAFDRIEAGRVDDPRSIVPIYSRLSAAEEKRIASPPTIR